MKIVINCRMLNKRHGGPRRFLVNMLINLAKIDNKNKYYLLVDKTTEFVYDWPRNFKIINLKTKSRIIYEYIKLPKYINRLNPDIFIVPDPVFSPNIKTKKKIAIYHDIIYFEKGLMREFKFFDNLHHKIMIPLSGRRTNLIVCVSKFTESRVHELLGFKNTKVIYEGVEENFNPRSLEEQNLVLLKYGISRPFLFFIGSMSPRKNIERVIDGFCSVKSIIKHNLYLVGGYSWNDSAVREKLNRPDIKDRVKKIGYIEESDLPAIYSAADALIYPSLYEGFGLPIVEAQACCCPVITSNIGATKEVAGSAAILVDPLSVSDISAEIIKICNKKYLKEEIILKGGENIKRFSWGNFAKSLIEEYEKI